MRKSILFIIFFLLMCVAYFGYIHFTAADLPTFGLNLSGEKGKIKNLTKNFLEAIKFKNNEAIKSFIASDTPAEELNNFFKKTFDMSYEEINLEKFSIEEIEIDSSKTRCKIKINITGTNQITKEPFTKIRVLYWYLDLKAWLIDIKNIVI